MKISRLWGIPILLGLLTGCGAPSSGPAAPAALPPRAAATNTPAAAAVPASATRAAAALEAAAEPTLSPSAAPTARRADLPDLGPAPELTNQVWLNVERPLRLTDLRGRVVLVDMWTYG